MLNFDNLGIWRFVTGIFLELDSQFKQFITTKYYFKIEFGCNTSQLPLSVGGPMLGELLFIRAIKPMQAALNSCSNPTISYIEDPHTRSVSDIMHHARAVTHL